jgi:hypothetical protein
MNTNKNINPEAAAETSTPTPEQIAAAQAILAAVQQQSVINEQVVVDPVNTVSGIDPIKKLELETKFQELINTPRYWENPNRIKRLAEALVLPVYDSRSMQQFFISANDELVAKEMKSAIQESRVPVMPTDDEIKSLAEKKYEDKQIADAAKEKAAEEKAAKKTK